MRTFYMNIFSLTVINGLLLFHFCIWDFMTSFTCLWDNRSSTLAFFVCVLCSAIIQKRLKKEKKAKRKLQEALEYESKRREQAEQSLKQTSPTESLRSLNGESCSDDNSSKHRLECDQMCFNKFVAVYIYYHNKIGEDALVLYHTPR